MMHRPRKPRVGYNAGPRYVVRAIAEAGGLRLCEERWCEPGAADSTSMRDDTKPRACILQVMMDVVNR
jgi:hypothetical protein